MTAITTALNNASDTHILGLTIVACLAVWLVLAELLWGRS